MPLAVLYDRSDRLFKMWYRCTDYGRDRSSAAIRPALALSQDGVSWRRPELGLVEFGGSRKNNLIDAPPWVQSIVDDPREQDPTKRFKSLGYGRPSEGTPGRCLHLVFTGWPPLELRPSESALHRLSRFWNLPQDRRDPHAFRVGRAASPVSRVHDTERRFPRHRPVDQRRLRSMVGSDPGSGSRRGRSAGGAVL